MASPLAIATPRRFPPLDRPGRMRLTLAFLKEQQNQQEKPMMSHRGFVLVAMLALVTAVWLAVALVGAQAPAATPYTPPTSRYNAPRTPWGDPDLMGVWDYQSVIHMQRPDDLAGKARFTDAEYEAWARANAP